MNRIPVTIVTGALGSGKTSLLNQLLPEPEMAGCAVIINEYGQIGLDHELVVKIDGPLRLLESGCICCSVQGELVETLRDLFMRSLRREIPSIRRVVIETTGLAQISPLRQTLRADFFLADRFELASVVTVIDACHLSAQLTHSPEVMGQVVQADLLLMSKTDLATAEQLATTEAAARRYNPLAPIHRYGPGNAKPAWLLDTPSIELPRLALVPAGHEQDVWTLALTSDQPLPWGAFTQVLDRCWPSMVRPSCESKACSGCRALRGVGYCTRFIISAILFSISRSSRWRVRL